MTFVSIIIPVYNDLERLCTCLDALQAQSYPKQHYEVIVIDNGSQNDIQQPLSAYSQVLVCHEKKPGSYAARNKGLSLARGDIIGFTDSDCLPASNWIANGVKHLTADNHHDVLAGKIELFFNDPAQLTAVEVLEKAFAFPQENYVRDKHFGATANLFTTRKTLAAVGPFNTKLTSGGDMEWGQRAYLLDFKLGYAHDLVVLHPARRSFQQLRQKRLRVVSGHEDISQHQARFLGLFDRNLFASSIPSFKELRLILQTNELGLAQKAQALWMLFHINNQCTLLKIRIRLGGQHQQR